MRLNPLIDEFFREFFGIPEKSESDKAFEAWLGDNYPKDEETEDLTA